MISTIGRVNFEIARYEPRMLGQVACLQKRLWSPEEDLNAAYFHWKHECNPYSETPEVYVALANGRVIAMRGFFGSRWEGGDQITPAILPIADDAVAAPEHENTGATGAVMARALDELSAIGYAYVLNFSASPVTLMSSLATGWRASSPLGMMRRGDAGDSSRPRRTLQRLPLLWRLASHRFFDAREERQPFCDLDRTGEGALRRISRHLSVAREPRLQEIAHLITRINHDGRLRQVRDFHWLRWRFENPLAAYRFIYWDDRELRGFLVLERRVSPHADRTRVAIVDCEAIEVDVLEQLLTAAIAVSPSAPILTWRHALPWAASPLLEPLGFSAQLPPGALARQRPCVLVRGLRDAAGPDWRLGGLDLLNLQNWDLRRLYAD